MYKIVVISNLQQLANHHIPIISYACIVNISIIIETSDIHLQHQPNLNQTLIIFDTLTRLPNDHERHITSPHRVVQIHKIIYDYI